MKHHAFPLRAAAAAAGMAVLLTGGTTTGAMAATVATSATSAKQGTPTAPGVPTGLTATPGNGIATLSWSAPSSDGGSPVDDYVIQGGTSPSSDAIVDNVGGNAATISGLTNGTLYYFSVHAQNAYGDGASATVQVTPVLRGFTPASLGQVPGSPTGLKASPGDGFIALSWSAPTSAGRTPVTGYRVYLGYSPSLTGAREFTTSATSFRLNDARNGSQYYIKVTAVNETGEGPGTPVTSVIPGPQQVLPQPGPARPTGLIAWARHGGVVLSWSRPAGGLKAGEGYFIYIGTRSGQEGSTSAVSHPIENATSYTIAPLKNGTRYYFQVALLSADNRVSARSAEVSAVPVPVIGSVNHPATSPTARVGGGAGSGSQAGSGSSAAPGGSAGSGSNVTTQPSLSALQPTDQAQEHSSSSLPTGLIVLLALVLAAAAGAATAIMLLRGRRYDRRRYGPVPAPRRPHDDQPTGPSSHIEEMNGPRYR